ncbi:MAG: hypothetical protein ACOYEG_09750 [Petrimonas sp.]|jgi:hypothetical protein
MKKTALLLFAILFAHFAYSQYTYTSDYDYQLNWELDTKTGKYRPAYTYKASAGNSTIWLDSGGKENAESSKSVSSTKAEVNRFVTVTFPDGWEVEKNAELMKTFAADGTQFTVYKSYVSSASQNAEFKTNWKRFYPKRDLPDVQTQTYEKLGKVLTSIDVIEAHNGNLSANVLVMILADSVYYPLTLHFPSFESFEKYLGEMKRFIGSFEINRGEIQK